MTDCYLDFFCIMSVDDGSGSRFEQQKQQPDKSYMHVDFAPATGVSGKSWVWTLGWGQKDATGRKYWEICDKIQKETLGDSSSALLMPVELFEQLEQYLEKLKTDVEEVSLDDQLLSLEVCPLDTSSIFANVDDALHSNVLSLVDAIDWD